MRSTRISSSIRPCFREIHTLQSTFTCTASLKHTFVKLQSLVKSSSFFGIAEWKTYALTRYGDKSQWVSYLFRTTTALLMTYNATSTLMFWLWLAYIWTLQLRYIYLYSFWCLESELWYTLMLFFYLPHYITVPDIFSYVKLLVHLCGVVFKQKKRFAYPWYLRTTIQAWFFY